jgi:2-hydroxy-6-oxonona-2,4-dienedioate hydrolase
MSNGGIAARLGGVAVRTWGAGAPLVLLHGGMGSWNHWVRNIEALAARFTVRALDLPGCGDSDSVPKDIPDDDYVGLVAEAVEAAAGGQPVNLAGFSFGGITSAMVAVRLGRRMRKLCLVSPGGFGQGNVLDLRKIPPDEAGLPAVRAVLRHNLQIMMCADPANVTEETIDLHYSNYKRVRFDGRRFSLGNQMAETLKRVTCPVQTIWGERDALPRPDIHARIYVCRAALPGVRVDVVPGAGHWVQYEAPAAVNRVMTDFFST